MKQEPTAVTMAGIYELLDMEISDINADIIQTQDAEDMIQETADAILGGLEKMLEKIQDAWICGDISGQDQETAHARMTEIYRAGIQAAGMSVRLAAVIRHRIIQSETLKRIDNGL